MRVQRLKIQNQLMDWYPKITSTVVIQNLWEGSIIGLRWLLRRESATNNHGQEKDMMATECVKSSKMC